MVKVSGFMYEFINRSHQFIDGNKRCAIATVFETCMMNGFMYKPIDGTYEAEFARRIASTTSEEVGLEEIFSYFNDRIIKFKQYFEPTLWRIKFNCPLCHHKNDIHHRKCIGCGKREIKKITITHRGLLRDYDFIYHTVEIDRLARQYRMRKM